MEETLIIDRFEGDIAVCETERLTMVDIPCDLLPAGVHEGDCLVRENGRYLIDEDETARRRRRIGEKARRLFRD